MGNVANVAVAANGAMAVAPTGSTAPTDSTTALAAAFKDLGLVSEDGLTSGMNLSTVDIKAWDGTIVRKAITSSEFSFKIKLLETNGNVLDLYYAKPTITVVSAKTKITIKTPTRDLRAFVFDTIDGTDFERIHVPNGEVTDRQEIPYKNSEGKAYELTITAYPDNTGATSYRYYNRDLTPL